MALTKRKPGRPKGSGAATNEQRRARGTYRKDRHAPAREGPPKPKRRRAGVGGLTPGQWHHLALGWPDAGGFRTRDELVAAWRAIEEAVLPAWVRAFPGSRPFGWWLAEGRERRVLSAAEVRAWAADYPDSWARCPPADGGALAGGWAREGWAAGPEGEPDRPPTFGLLYTHTLPPLQEAEATYLDRHGLLGAAEEAALEAGEGEEPVCYPLGGGAFWAIYGAGPAPERIGS